jgi:hypothetical protein
MDEPVDFEDVEQALVLDIVWAGHSLDQIANSENASRSPDDAEYDDLFSDVLETGGVLVYRNSEISLGRGAELLGIPVGEFREVLASHGIEPRIGPQSSEELWSENGFDDIE